MPEIRDRTIKRLRYRAWHRGTRELDLLIGRFADAHLEALDDDQLHRFELLLNQPDPDMYDWILERRIAPPVQQSDVLSLLIAFNKTL